MESEVRMGGERRGCRGRYGAKRQSRQHCVRVRVAEEGDAVTATRAGVRSGWDHDAMHLKGTRKEGY